MLAFHSNYVSLLHIFRRQSEILVENRQFQPTPPAFGAHTEGDRIRILPKNLNSIE